jgi:hypothetical protein
MLQEQVVAQKPKRYEHWLATLDAFDVQFLVLDVERDGGLLQAARSRPEWVVDLEDGDVVLFARAGMAGKAKGVV